MEKVTNHDLQSMFEHKGTVTWRTFDQMRPDPVCCGDIVHLLIEIGVQIGERLGAMVRHLMSRPAEGFGYVRNPTTNAAGLFFPDAVVT